MSFFAIIEEFEKLGKTFTAHEIERYLDKMAKDGNVLTDERIVEMRDHGKPRMHTFYTIIHEGELLYLS